MNSSSAGAVRVSSGWIMGAAMAVFTAVAAAAATSGSAVAAVDAIVEVLTGTPPPASPPLPRLPAGAPVPERRVYLKPPGDESKLDPRAPTPPKAFIEPAKVATQVKWGTLPERTRAGREDPAMCSAQCQATANAVLQKCDGYLTRDELAALGGNRPSPSCRRDLIGIYQSCLLECGIEPSRAGARP